MGDGVVVDTNIISNYYQEYIEETGDIYGLIEKLLKNCGIAITELLENEWHNTCGSQLFDVWFTDNVRDGYIQYVKPYINRQILKKIHNDFGLPKEGRDKELIKAANVTTYKYILTKDIDLFDPKKKQASIKEKERIKKERKGRLRQFLRRKLDITVGLPEHCWFDLEGYLSP
jgi:predicted nucleic acid-binding protein